MLPRNHPDRIKIAFDDHRLVANAGLLLPATLALHLGLSQLVQQRLDLGDAPGRANTGDKMMTLVASALAGGDCIDDADALRAGGTAGVLDCLVKAPSTLGTFLRSFRWGHEPNAQFLQRPGELRGVTPSPELLFQTLRSLLVEFWNMLCRSLYRAIGIPWRSMISLSISM